MQANAPTKYRRMPSSEITTKDRGPSDEIVWTKSNPGATLRPSGLREFAFEKVCGALGLTSNWSYVKGLIRDIDPDAYTKPKLSASTTEAKEAKKARREETVRRKAVQEEMSLIAMRVFENLLARESAENTIDGSSQFERASCDVPVDSD